MLKRKEEKKEGNKFYFTASAAAAGYMSCWRIMLRGGREILCLTSYAIYFTPDLFLTSPCYLVLEKRYFAFDVLVSEAATTGCQVFDIPSSTSRQGLYNPGVRIGIFKIKSGVKLPTFPYCLFLPAAKQAGLWLHSVFFFFHQVCTKWSQKTSGNTFWPLNCLLYTSDAADE